MPNEIATPITMSLKIIIQWFFSTSGSGLLLVVRQEQQQQQSEVVFSHVVLAVTVKLLHWLRGSWMGFNLASFLRPGSSMNCGAQHIISLMNIVEMVVIIITMDSNWWFSHYQLMQCKSTEFYLEMLVEKNHLTLYLNSFLPADEKIKLYKKQLSISLDIFFCLIVLTSLLAPQPSFSSASFLLVCGTAAFWPL